MEDRKVYIDQSAIDSSLYSTIQGKTLDELQRLSGKKWTNFNAHDPGVTTVDIANYALSELDYKLGFDLIDYLTLEFKGFEPERFGLFLPEKVYSTMPVTVEDYRRLFLYHIPELDNVVVELNKSKKYDIKYTLSPFLLPTGEIVEDRIKEVYHSNRNLCEILGEIKAGNLTELHLHSEIEVESTEVVESVLAQIYWSVMSYLNGGIRFESFEQLHEKEYLWEERFEGPKSGKRLVIPKLKNTMTELSGMLSKISGLKKLKTCYLSKEADNLNDVITEFREWYSLAIPKEMKSLKVKIRVGNDVINEIDFESFNNKLKALYMLYRSSTNPNGEDENVEISRKLIPKGKYRDVYDFCNIAKDFPACYRTDVGEAKQFGSYLKLFDILIRKGLGELKNVKELLSIEGGESSAMLPVDLLESGDVDRDISSIKNQYLDLLDHLYGVDSNPKWIQTMKNEAPKDTLERRIKLLRNIPGLLQMRSKAYNITNPESRENLPTIKVYLAYLLGMSECDYLYVLEHSLFTNAQQTVSFIFLSEVAPFGNKVFQMKVGHLIRHLLPAHLEVCVYWLEEDRFTSFKESYNNWKNAIALDKTEEKKAAEKRLFEI